MKSRTSCCNSALLRRDISRSALLWGAYLLLWFVAMPANILSESGWRTALELQTSVVEIGAGSCHWVNFVYGPAVALFLFSYLYKSRSANFFGALPLRREGQFLTHYVAGLLCSLVPNFVIMGLTMVFGGIVGANLVTESAIWFATQSLTFLFYYSFGVLCANLVGHVVAMPLLYLVLNFTAVVLETMAQVLVEALIYGMAISRRSHLSWLSPFFYFAMDGNGPDCKNVYELSNLIGYEFTGWTGLLILAGVGLVFAVVAFFCYQYRRMESASDVMAIRHLRPVFLYVFTLGCTFVGGTILAEMLVGSMDSSRFTAISACLLASTVLGFFLGQMILAKSLRVFSRGSFTRCGIVCALVAAVLLGCRMDVLGVARYVPSADEVTGVQLNADNSGSFVEAPQRIEEALALHEEIVQRQRETERLLRKADRWSPNFTFTYRLADGSEISRSYDLPVRENSSDSPDALIRKMETLINTPEMIVAREMPEDYANRKIYNCFIHYPTGNGGQQAQIDPSIQQTKELWLGAMLEDMLAGNMGTRYYTWEHRNLPRYTDVSVEIQLEGKVTDGRNYYWFSVTEDAVHTIKALQELGVPEEAFEIREESK